MNNVYSVFEKTYLKKEENCNPYYKTELNFYMGDLSGVNLSKDWRFKEVKEIKKKEEIVLRYESKYLGLVSNLEFPVIYPLKLNTITIIKNE